MIGSNALEAFGHPADVTTPLLTIRGLHQRFAISGKRRHTGSRHQTIHALNGVNLTLQRGDALCVVGESGSGKSTLARAIMGLLPIDDGEIRYDGERIDRLSSRQRQRYRRRMQMIFQDPHASLNPRLTLRQTLEEPIRVHHPDWRRDRVGETARALMRDVGIDPAWSERYAHELSGGQRQRIAIARALTVGPEFIVADEPVAALDLSVQAQVLNLLLDAQAERRLTYLFITHDLAVVEHFATRVAVMYLGTICEVASADALFSRPRHPYTEALLAARPRFDDTRPPEIRLRGETSMPLERPEGCVFCARCPHANMRCRREAPVSQPVEQDHRVACHAVEEGRI